MGLNKLIIKQFAKKIKLFFIVMVLFNACQTINLTQALQTNTNQIVSLGSIGSEKEFLLQKGFNSSAIPNYKAPIKLAVITNPFTKQTHKKFTKAKDLQLADVNVNYIDSIANKPNYIQLQIADKVAVVSALNNEVNTGVKAYLKHHDDAHVLTSISIAFSPKDMERIISADAVFLVEYRLKTYALQLYKEHNKWGAIPFNKGVIFEYQTSNCCWQENKKHQVDIVDLVSTYNNCPKSTYRSSKRAEKKTTNYYKL